MKRVKRCFEIEVYITSGTHQLKARKGWDDCIYFECGSEWEVGHGFGHPIPGRSVFELEGSSLSQRTVGAMVCHYPITLSEDIIRQLEPNRIPA